MARPSSPRRLRAIVVASTLLFTLPIGLASAAPAGHALRGAHSSGSLGVPAVTKARYVNAAGWTIHTAVRAATDIRGSWIVAPLGSKCTSGPQPSAEWQAVAMDGATSSFMELLGTYASCSSSTVPARQYGAFYVFGTGSAAPINLTIHAKDYISAEIKFASNHFTLSLRDLNSSKSFSTSFSRSLSAAAPRNAVTWYVGVSYPGNLAPFGTAKFGWNYTHVRSTNTANISGALHNIGGFSGRIQMFMYVGSTTTQRAVPSNLNSNGSSFTVTWKHY